jgi:malate dehydrogenase (oxaloacetate-decarboxylating)
VAHARPSAGYALVMTVTTKQGGEALGALVATLTGAGGDVAGMFSEPGDDGTTTHVAHVKAVSAQHQDRLVEMVRALPGVVELDAVDQVFELHQGGKLAIEPRHPLVTDDDLAQLYTPGVGRVSQAIADAPERVWELTGRSNAVAVLSNGSAVLGLGDVGPAAALPVMEGKAILFKQLADVDAYPVCVDARSADELVAVARAIAPTFGGINLEDVAAPTCFEAERRMRDELDIPVFHDDQHGTAVVVLAALLNAARVVERPVGDLRVAVVGAGAAGIATTELLLAEGVGDVVLVDRVGVLHPDRADGMNDAKREIAARTNRSGCRGGPAEALRGADVLVGVSGPACVEPAWLAAMGERAVVFALANPVPEVQPEAVPGNVAVVATGRSDYPNQINNVLVFPGFFRGLLDVGARRVDDAVKLAAARALAGVVGAAELGPSRIIPSPFDPRVVHAVAAAVRDAAGPSDRSPR